MTAPVEVRVPDDLTLLGRLNRLVERVQGVADAGGRDAPFAAGILGQLAPIVAAAAIQADRSDQVEMFRAEAADRERAREGLRNLVDLVRGLKPGALSKPWLIERLTGSIGRLDDSLKSKPGEFPTMPQRAAGGAP